MAHSSPSSILGGAALGAGGIVAALIAGAPLGAALVALFAGIAAFALVHAGGNVRVAPSEPSPHPVSATSLPDLRKVFDAIEEPLLLVRDRRILLANHASRTVLGPHVEGVDVRLAIRHPAAAERLAATVPSPDEGRLELVGIGEAGRRWEMATARLAEGAILVHLTDRSAAHAAEQMRVDFVANASHELRTPLATLLGFLETLQDEDMAADGKTRARFLDIMFQEANRMRTLLDELMSLSRIEADRYLAPRDTVDLLPLAEEVKASLARPMAERGATIRIESRIGAAAVAGDRPQLAQMLHNLLSNALAYGRTGGAVTLRLEEAGPDMLCVSIADDGEGIAPEHLPRLTERFYRVDAGRSRSMGGTGLGLAIVKHIVGRHRGRLDIRSTRAVGTTVRAYLPRAQRNEPLSSKSHGSVPLGGA